MCPIIIYQMHESIDVSISAHGMSGNALDFLIIMNHVSVCMLFDIRFYLRLVIKAAALNVA